MSIDMIKSLKIGNLIAKLPIIQGGMGVGISMAGLASAVANHGGFGVISTACAGILEPDLSKNYLEANIRALSNEIQYYGGFIQFFRYGKDILEREN